MNEVTTMPVPVDPPHYGAAMQALSNDRMREFVSILVATGCSLTEAAIAAGYHKAYGYRLASDPKIQAALHEESVRRISAHVPMAIEVLVSVAKDKSAKGSDRIKAATEILSRGGLHPITESHVTITHRTEQEKDAEILSLARELGLDSAATEKLLGHKVIEAEFTEVYPNVNGPGAPGRPVSNPDRTDEERARDREGKNRTPEEREEHNAKLREARSEFGRMKYAFIHGDITGIEDLIGLDPDPAPSTDDTLSPTEIL